MMGDAERSLLDQLDLLERTAKMNAADQDEITKAARVLRSLINMQEATARFTEALRETTRTADALRLVLRQVKQNGVVGEKQRPGKEEVT